MENRLSDIKVGYKCNNNCRHCVVADKRKFGDWETRKLKLEIEEAKKSGCNSLTLTGGEPTIRKDFLEILSFVNKLGFDHIDIQTNGRKFSNEKFVKEVSKYQNKISLLLAVHGDDDKTHDYITMVPGSFDETIRGIKNIIKYGIKITTNTVITKLNYKKLPEVVEFLINLDVKNMHLSFVHIQGNAYQNFNEIVPRKSKVSPFIHKAIDICKSYDVNVYVEAMPFCFMQGYEDHILERYMNSPIEVREAMGFIPEFKTVRKEIKSKGPPCSICEINSICEGPWKEYTEKYGWNEFNPIINTKNKAIVIELTDRNDLKEKNEKNDYLDISLIENLIYNENIKNIELGGSGNPLLHPKMKEILELLYQNNIGTTIVTNGLKLREIISKIEDPILKNTHFCLYLDHPDKEKNDGLMVKGSHKKTIESMEYLQSRGIKYDILMRINSKNYDKIEEMLEIAKHYNCNLLLPMETSPINTKKGLLLTDKMKIQVINTIHRLRDIGEPIFKVIHFETPPNNCSYLRKERLFINSKGQLGFCHFLSDLDNSWIVDIEDKSLEELIKINNFVRNKFLEKKSKEINTWNLTRKMASPCSYCLKCYGVKEKW
jgi:MoaA/NifB/PqqE/SkfB family radical SAM enzyme